MDPIILAIDTSCDETAAAVVWGRRILSNVISSQVDIHAKYGGVYPALAKRAHIERIDGVIFEALKRASIAYKKINYHSPGITKATTLRNSKGSPYESNRIDSDFHSRTAQCKRRNDTEKQPVTTSDNLVTTSDGLRLDAVAVTQGPGLAIALEVGILKAKEIAISYQLPLIAINHLEGHILSTIAQNSAGNPKREIRFPALALVVSGGNTQMLIVHAIGKYEMIGETLDDACGEALDKAARILHLGYPGGPIIERLALTGDPKKYVLKPTLIKKNDFNFSYSGLKTAFLYLVQKLPEKEFGANLHNLASAFQYWAFEQIQRKLTRAIAVYQPKTVLCGGGVIANTYLRNLIHRSASKFDLSIYFPTNKLLYGDNAAMIGVAAHYKYLRGDFISFKDLDRKPGYPLG